ncbi:SMI1/KNR4 family protein [Myroides odoratimimus]|nr:MULTISPECIES: SMI1/KNR4 family protein [Myroides]MCS7472472.1 SMI1/KNR4 family protein [Myroides odoratimimus]WHT74299.1 SMI1/KNR4 family protein [Myroides odoratimimus]WHU38879.1 SMI1/KNR4 family protein [Myroides odoratimimus]
MSKFNHYTVIPNIHTQSSELVLPSVEDINNCEQVLNFNFEEDYKTYILQYGVGVLGGTYIRIYAPNRMITERKEWLE